jgi:VIT1/CCC1 family predicted Fe2+/Mn2+ transporter
VTIFCCTPLGIPAIVYAADVRTKLADGRNELARRSADMANTFITIAFWLGFVGGLFYLIVYLFIFGALTALH